MTISFDQIPAAIRTPGTYIEINNSGAVGGLPGQAQRILVLGQRLTAGSVAAGVPKLVTSVQDAEAFWGRGSLLHGMFAALKAANRFTESWGVALDDDAGGVQATGKLSVTGPATAAGTLFLYVGGVRITVAVASGDTATEVAAAVVAAVNARTDLPVTAAVNGVNDYEADITARHKGETGNSIDLRFNFQQGEALPAGIGVTVTPMANGTSNPDIGPAVAAIGDDPYETIIFPYTDATSLTALETELDRRWEPLVQREGHAFAAASGTVGALTTMGNSRNNPHVTIMAAGKSPTPPWVWAAVVGGIDAREPDPARPRQTLTLPGLLAPAEADRHTQSERNTLLFDGIATHLVAPGGTVAIERLVTTYQLNTLGVADASYLDVTTLRTIAALRQSVRTRIALKYPRHKLADDGTAAGPGQAIVTPATIRHELIALFGDWENAGWVEGRAQFITDLVVERDQSDANRLNAVIPPDIVNGFRVFAAQIKFLL
jgi:phage tail sheath gpL-like